jgi:hypothetical protein
MKFLNWFSGVFVESSIPLYQCLGSWTKQHNANCIHDHNYFVKFTINSYISIHNYKYRWNLLKKVWNLYGFLVSFHKRMHYLSNVQWYPRPCSCPCTSLIPFSRWQCGLPDWHMSSQGSRSFSCPPISHCPWIASYVTRYHTKKMY